MADPKTRAEDAAHDVLAAEAFGMPTADPSLRHRPIMLPDDPSGIAEPHDVLAAEEFAMPATRPGEGSGGALARAAREARPSALAAAGSALALVAMRVLRRRRRG